MKQTSSTFLQRVVLKTTEVLLRADKFIENRFKPAINLLAGREVFPPPPDLKEKFSPSKQSFEKFDITRKPSRLYTNHPEVIKFSPIKPFSTPPQKLKAFGVLLDKVKGKADTGVLAELDLSEPLSFVSEQEVEKMLIMKKAAEAMSTKAVEAMDKVGLDDEKTKIFGAYALR